MFISQVLSAALQVILFSLIPLIWWGITARKKEKFFSWIGLKKPQSENMKRDVLYIAGIIILFFAIGQLALHIRGDMEASDLPYKGMGAAAIPAIIVYALAQTSLSEEILFRGFIMKRLQAKFGFMPAAVITSVVFGASHLAIVWGQASVIAGAVLVIYPMLMAFVLAWINEKRFDGSIIPSWIIHGTLNTLQSILTAFVVVNY